MAKHPTPEERPARRRRIPRLGRRGGPLEPSAPANRILVIDDDPDILLLLRLLLEAGGFVPATADDGAVGLERMVEFAPSLIVLDMMMPQVDGWEVLRSVGDGPDAPPVIVLSAKVGTLDRVRALEMGAAEYVSKPFHPQELVDTIRDVLNRGSKGRREHRARTLAELRGAPTA